MARTIASMTPPSDAIATNAIGAIGYFAERRTVDITGEIDSARGLTAIVQHHAKHLALFGPNDSLAQYGLSHGLLSLEIKLTGADDHHASLYRVLK